MLNQYLKYCIVGGTGVVINFSILYSLTTFLDIHYLISNIFAIGTAMTSNFILNRNWTFSTPTQPLKRNT